MKAAVLYLLLVFGTLPFGWTQQQKPPNPNQRNANSTAQQQPKPTLATSDNQTPADHDKQPTESHSEQPTWWNADRGTWALVIVGFLGTGAAVWTLLILSGQLREMRGAGELMKGQLEQMQKQAAEMEKQTLHIEGSLAAAKTSADIAARIAIPTLHIETFENGNRGAADLRAMLRFPKVHIVIKNYGQTPAFLRSWNIVFKCEDLPPEPDYWGHPASGMVLEREVVQPNGSYTLPELPSWKWTEFSLEDVEAIIRRKKKLWAYGFICYYDLFGSPLRRIKFCELALNISDGWIQWVGFAAPYEAYVGTEDYIFTQPTTGEGIEGQTPSADSKADDQPKQAN